MLTPPISVMTTHRHPLPMRSINSALTLPPVALPPASSYRRHRKTTRQTIPLAAPSSSLLTAQAIWTKPPAHRPTTAGNKRAQLIEDQIVHGSLTRRDMFRRFCNCYACNSLGREKTIFSGRPRISRAGAAPQLCSLAMTSCTNTSGAEAPAVMPMCCLPANHSR